MVDIYCLSLKCSVVLNHYSFFGVKIESELGFIQPDKRTKNVFIESGNGKFRNEYLNLHWFRTIEEARYEIDL